MRSRGWRRQSITPKKSIRIRSFHGPWNPGWPAAVKALRAAGDTDWVTAEMIPPAPFYKHGPEALIHNTSRAMDAILKLA